MLLEALYGDYHKQPDDPLHRRRHRTHCRLEPYDGLENPLASAPYTPS
jgi:hypothetical protein